MKLINEAPVLDFPAGYELMKMDEESDICYHIIGGIVRMYMPDASII